MITGKGTDIVFLFLSSATVLDGNIPGEFTPQLLKNPNSSLGTS